MAKWARLIPGTGRTQKFKLPFFSSSTKIFIFETFNQSDGIGSNKDSNNIISIAAPKIGMIKTLEVKFEKSESVLRSLLFLLLEYKYRKLSFLCWWHCYKKLDSLFLASFFNACELGSPRGTVKCSTRGNPEPFSKILNEPEIARQGKKYSSVKWRRKNKFLYHWHLAGVVLVGGRLHWPTEGQAVETGGKKVRPRSSPLRTGRGGRRLQEWSLANRLRSPADRSDHSMMRSGSRDKTVACTINILTVINSAY